MTLKVTTKEIARICGVSVGTVDRALNNRKGINQVTRERILGAAKQLGYRSPPACAQPCDRLHEDDRGRSPDSSKPILFRAGGGVPEESPPCRVPRWVENMAEAVEFLKKKGFPIAHQASFAGGSYTIMDTKAKLGVNIMLKHLDQE